MKHTVLFLILFPVLLHSQPHAFPVRAERMESRLLQLADFGKNAAGQTNRVAYSLGDQLARKWMVSLMQAAGLAVHIDFAGNIIGRRAGQHPDLPPLVFGSHIDMVPLGGNYDGCVGSIAALEVMQVLQEHAVTTRHPLEMIIFSNEEGGVVGSRALAGNLEPDALDMVSSSGLTLRDGIGAIDGNPDSIAAVRRKPGEIAAFLELHIEQGSVLDDEGIQIGVVEGIVGIEWWEISVKGFANHAGTTPMDKRKDALLAASEIVLAVNAIITSEAGRQVGTVGRLETSPGAPNVIPGNVKLSLEIRDLSYEKMMLMFDRIKARALEIGQSRGVEVSFRSLNVSSQPALASPDIQQTISEVTAALGYSWKKMPSGAGHDAQEMALIAPMGMIFIPSKGGISHSPLEFSTATDIARGAQVLLETLLRLDNP